LASFQGYENFYAGMLQRYQRLEGHVGGVGGKKADSGPIYTLFFALYILM
jgi:hypothetical protein